MEGCTVADVKEKEQRKDEKLFKIRHSTAHVMAEAVLRLFPDAKLAIGPAIENGFYYDFDLPRSLKPEDLEEIENIMKDIVKQNHEFDYKVVSREEAKKLFADQPYKLELVDAIPEGDTVSLYTPGYFYRSLPRSSCREHERDQSRQLQAALDRGRLLARQ